MQSLLERENVGSQTLHYQYYANIKFGCSYLCVDYPTGSIRANYRQDFLQSPLFDFPHGGLVYGVGNHPKKTLTTLDN